MKNIIVTGGAGFIGSNFVHYMLKNHPEYNLIVVDKLTYAGNLENLRGVEDKITFAVEDICDYEKMKEIIKKYNVDAIVHFAAESHVDNSIADPLIFTKTNVLGTHSLLEAARQVWGEGSDNKFVHISTDEVYGSLGKDGYFTEESPINPSSPYSASKASSDLIALAYANTYNMNVSVTNCSNNYGPYQHSEKLIPHMIQLAIDDRKLPVYGNGKNIRDWLYVEDHCSAIDKVLHEGKKGQRYNIGGHNEKENLEIVNIILEKLGKSEDLIEFVEDRKGHDFRYAIDPTKIKEQLGWEVETYFDEGIGKTIDWYIDHLSYFDKPVRPVLKKQDDNKEQNKDDDKTEDCE